MYKAMAHPKRRFYMPVFLSYVCFTMCVLSVGVYGSAFALSLDALKANFLKGDYKSAIQEGEKILAESGHPRNVDEVYYMLGTSYLKTGKYLRASDIFEIILKECKDSKFSEEAKLALGDAYFLNQDLFKAQKHYNELLIASAHTKFKAALYQRLSQLYYKKGDASQGKLYFDKLNREFPLHLEAASSSDICDLADTGSYAGAYYSVQVGCFSSAVNASNLNAQLKAKGYDSYAEEIDAGGKKAYRVRVGKYKSRSEAAALENRLSQAGYPTKITP